MTIAVKKDGPPQALSLFKNDALSHRSLRVENRNSILANAVTKVMSIPGYMSDGHGSGK